MLGYSIREMASAEDLACVVEMSGRFLNTTHFGTLVQATPQQLEALTLKIAAIGVVLVAYAEIDLTGPRACGFVALAKLEQPINGTPYADEMAWWVEPEFRQSGIGRLLLERAEAWAIENGCSMVKMVAPADSTIGAFYEKHGYVAFETEYWKDLR